MAIINPKTTTFQWQLLFLQKLTHYVPCNQQPSSQLWTDMALNAYIKTNFHSTLPNAVVKVSPDGTNLSPVATMINYNINIETSQEDPIGSWKTFHPPSMTLDSWTPWLANKIWPNTTSLNLICSLKMTTDSNLQGIVNQGKLDNWWTSLKMVACGSCHVPNLQGAHA